MVGVETGGCVAHHSGGGLLFLSLSLPAPSGGSGGLGLEAPRRVRPLGSREPVMHGEAVLPTRSIVSSSVSSPGYSGHSSANAGFIPQSSIEGAEPTALLTPTSRTSLSSLSDTGGSWWWARPRPATSREHSASTDTREATSWGMESPETLWGLVVTRFSCPSISPKTSGSQVRSCEALSQNSQVKEF